MDNVLLNRTKEKALAWHARWPNSVVLWSGGKDSTALLHFLKFECDIHLPTVQFREPKFRERYEYSDRLIKEWDLEVFDYAPARVSLSDGLDIETGEMRFDLLKHYQWGEKSVVLSLGTERPKGDEKYLCGIEYLRRPTGTFNWPWNAVHIGTKSSDTDLIKGHMPLSVDVRYAEGCPVSLYLLRDWADEDVYMYLEEMGVMPDPDRYEKAFGEWRHKPDKSKNADFLPTCLNCVDRHAPSHVHCPKLKATITNVSHLATYEDLSFADVGVKPSWQNGVELASKKQ
jgi:hypothetical protein